ncbi:MAG: vitamin K epoxide reductase family protein [Jiangellaceae bacterium]
MSEDRRLAWGLSTGGLIGFIAAAVLLIERLKLAQDSAYVPSCSINPVLSCGSVMETAQAALLGFPNPIIGVAAFPVVVTTGVSILAGARLARWYWLGLQVGVTAALALVSWLAFQSIYRIGALCPYCMVVWAVVIPLFWYVTLRNLERGAFGERVRTGSTSRFLIEWHAPLLLVPFLVLLGSITERFWSYWSTLL